MNEIWFASDFHGYHKNICSGSTTWKIDDNGQNTRPFRNEYEMTAKLIENINAKVAENDILYFLGDWSFAGINNTWNLRKRILCRNIHFILGNHDPHLEEVGKMYIIPLEDVSIAENFFQERMGSSESQRTVFLRDLFKSVDYYKEVSINKQRFVLCHFAFRVWNHSHKGTFHLYGHSHSSLDYGPNGKPAPWGKSMDVGVDNAVKVLGEMRPFHIDEVVRILQKRPISFLDHHSSLTN